MCRVGVVIPLSGDGDSVMEARPMLRTPALTANELPSGRRSGRVFGRAGRFAGWLAVAALLLASAPAAAEKYDESNAGHPLRMLAYAVHPVGVVYDYLLLRPAYWIGSHQPFRKLFGRTD